MNVDDYFEVYTGGNDYIKTWTPKALKEFAEDYHKQKLRDGENGILPLVSKRYEYKFKAMPPQGGYITDIVEANSRDEAKEILSKKYNEICWISGRL